jgi:hypothetical protein
MQMTNVKLYCIRDECCGSVLNEKASIGSRGLVRVSLGTRDRSTGNASIITPHGKVRNTFMGRYV